MLNPEFVDSALQCLSLPFQIGDLRIQRELCLAFHRGRGLHAKKLVLPNVKRFAAYSDLFRQSLRTFRTQ